MFNGIDDTQAVEIPDLKLKQYPWVPCFSCIKVYNKYKNTYIGFGVSIIVFFK